MGAIRGSPAKESLQAGVDGWLGTGLNPSPVSLTPTSRKGKRTQKQNTVFGGRISRKGESI